MLYQPSGISLSLKLGKLSPAVQPTPGPYLQWSKRFHKPDTLTSHTWGAAVIQASDNLHQRDIYTHWCSFCCPMGQGLIAPPQFADGKILAVNYFPRHLSFISRCMIIYHNTANKAKRGYLGHSSGSQSTTTETSQWWELERTGDVIATAKVRER